MANSFIAFVATISIFAAFSEAKSNGFSIDLIHRDSPKSPLYNPFLTPSQRLKNALQRSFHRINHFATLSGKKPFSSSSSSADIIPARGEYLMRISIGTPPIETLAIADTGSDLIWTQCQPCFKCFKQEIPLFNPKMSTTFKKIPCKDTICQAFQTSSSCNSSGGQFCLYSVLYGDGSSSKGDLVTETISLGEKINEKVSIKNTIFGCGHNNDGTFSDGTTGIIGLGGGKVSLVSQLGTSIQGKFSYCLVPFQETKSSKINFGKNGVFSGSDGVVVTTPIVPKSPDTFYFLTLEGISVGNQKLEYKTYQTTGFKQAVEEGNIIIDSGTTLTIVPFDFYEQLESQMRSQIKKKTVDDPVRVLSLCYESLVDGDIPSVIVHFKGGDLKLKSYNIFVQTSPLSTCLAFAPAQSMAIYGNIAQANFLVGFDLVKKTVTFESNDCTKN